MLQRKCACGGSSGLTGSCTECEKKKLLGQPLQTKLRISKPGDEYEREADRVAEKVMRMAEPGEDAARPKTAAAPLVQSKVNTSSGAISAAPPIVQQVLSSPGQPLDAVTRAFFEPRFGYDFGKVRVHADARAVESARAVNADAYTVGSHIAFGHGQHALHSSIGRLVVAHELSHVVQQKSHDFPHHAIVQKKAKLPVLKPEPVDCTKAITADYDCFDLIGEMIRLNADIRENDSYIKRYDSGELPFDKEVYDIRVKHRSELRNQYNEKELIRTACCATHAVPEEAPTAPPSAAPKSAEPETSSENR